ncbi:hypothetical protein GCM10028811_06410 [Uliginosibacterium sediminicola]
MLVIAASLAVEASPSLRGVAGTVGELVVGALLAAGFRSRAVLLLRAHNSLTNVRWLFDLLFMLGAPASRARRAQ